MKRSLRKIISVVTIISLLGTLSGSAVFTRRAEANWVDDWVSATSGGGPMYFEGQKRGYYSGGGFSARWGSTVDPLLTITAPKMKGGCGGIDMFLGGFSFMDFNYLVDKLQKILASVPAVAFDLALNVLCEPCSKAIKSFEAISDSLNGLQIDDCKAARGVTAKIMSSFVDDPSKKADLEAIYADFKQSSGMSNLYKAVTEGTRAAGDQPSDLALTMALNGCPANLRQIFGTSGYVLDKLQITLRVQRLCRHAAGRGGRRPGGGEPGRQGEGSLCQAMRRQRPVQHAQVHQRGIPDQERIRGVRPASRRQS